jgi:ferredoxin
MKKIIQDYKGCIGCGTCVALCPKFWEMNEEEMKARPIHGKKNDKTGKYELEIEEIGCNKDAADACPVRVIIIIDSE